MVALTKLEKEKIVAEVMRIAVEAVFSTHVYQFGGRYYHQTEGGPLCLRATGAIARVVMADLDVQQLHMLLENGVSWEVACRYVDDIRLILSALAAGWRWDGKRISFK